MNSHPINLYNFIQIVQNLWPLCTLRGVFISITRESENQIIVDIDTYAQAIKMEKPREVSSKILVFGN